MPEDVLPLWVADMDFKTTSYVEDAVIERTKHGIFGYSESGEEYFKEVAGWMRRHHNWEIRPEWLIKTPGVVFALAMAVKAFTDVVSEELVNGGKIQLVGFGTFEVSERPAREGRNPRTGETMTIAATKTPKFKVGKALKDMVNA